MTDKDFSTALRETIRCEIGKLLEQTQEADRVRKREREESDARRDTTISRLMELQVEDAEIKGKRERLTYRLIAATLAVVTSGAGGGLYVVSQPKPANATSAEIKTLREESNGIESRVRKTEEKIERVAESVVGQQVQISDGFDYLGLKIDAAHPRTAKAVKVPESVTEAKKAATKIKRRRGVKDLFSGIE